MHIRIAGCRIDLRKIILVIIPLLIGILIYFLDDYLSQNSLLIYIRYYGCDFLWSFSFSYLLLTINDGKVIVAILVAGIGWALEMLQFFNVVAGTGDIIDMIAEIVAVILAYGVVYKEMKNGK